MSAALLNLKSRLERSKLNEVSNEKTKGNDTGTLEITDSKTWVERIQSQGNKPDDWLQYTRYMRQNMKFTDRVKQHNFLSQMYDKAIKEIPIDANKKNESFALLFIEYSVIKRQYIPDDAEHLLSSARQMFRRLALVHIASAEFEAQKGNFNKAKKILEKARQFEASPDHLLLEAMKKLQDGQTELMSQSTTCELNTTTDNDYRSSTSSQESTSDFKNGLNLTNNLTDTSSNLTGQAFTNRIFTKTPQLPSVDSLTGITQGSVDIAGQMNVTDSKTDKAGHPKNSNDNLSNLNGFNGVNRCNRNNSNSSSNFLHDIRKPEDTSEDMPSEMDTAPIQVSAREDFDSFKSRLSNSCRATLRSYHSTPECRNVYKSSYTKFRRPAVIVMPQRVRRLNLPFTVPVDEESDENDTMSSFTPIDSSHGTHTSGYVSQSDATSPLDTTRSPVKDSLKTGHILDKKRSPLKALQVQNDSPLQNILPSSWKDKHQEKIPPKTHFEQVCSSDTMDSSSRNEKLNHESVSCFKIHESNKQTNNQNVLVQVKSQPDLSLNNRLQNEPRKQQDIDLGNLHQDNQKQTLENKQSQEKFLQQQQLALKERLLPLEQQQLDIQLQQQKLQQQNQLNTTQSETPASIQSKPVISTISSTTQAQISVDPTPSTAMSAASTTSKVQPAVTKTPGENPVPQMKVMLVNGHPYHVLSCVGKGGSSKVYKVLDLTGQPGLINALKVVSLDAANEQIVEGYKNEINLLKRLQYCPKVIHLYDFEHRKDENLLYILMECGELDFAKYLKNTVDREGKLSPLYIKFHWNSMLQAVGALHKEGIIHSDLKPSNFLLIDGELKLIDFGIAKAIQQDKTSIITDTQVGTLNYMSPETIRDYCGLNDEEEERKPVYKIGVKSDVWSLGCILYCMVYGHTPFQKIVKQFAKLQAIVNPSYKISFPEIQDKNLMDVMKNCLERDPKLRPSIDELLSHDYLLSV